MDNRPTITATLRQRITDQITQLSEAEPSQVAAALERVTSDEDEEETTWCAVHPDPNPPLVGRYGTRAR